MKKSERNGSYYYRKTITVGKYKNDAGNLVTKRKEFTAKTKKELDEKIATFLMKKEQGIETKTQYFGIMADGYINEFFINDSKLKDSTKRMYLVAWKNHIRNQEIYHMPLDEISSKTIQTLYNQLSKAGVPSAAIKKAHKLMRKVFIYLESEGYCRDATKNIVIPKEDTNEEDFDRNPKKVWTDDEIQTIMQGIKDANSRFRLRFLVVLAYYTGCRISELLALRYDDFTNNSVKISKQLGTKTEFSKSGVMKNSLSITAPKSKKSIREIPLSDEVMNELLIHKRWHQSEQLENEYRTDYVFTTNTGGWVDRQNVSHALKRLYKKIGVDEKSIHTYRHTFGTNLCKMGVPIQVASELMGHDNINTTARYYVNVSFDEKQKAVQALMSVIS